MTIKVHGPGKIYVLGLNGETVQILSGGQERYIEHDEKLFNPNPGDAWYVIVCEREDPTTKRSLPILSKKQESGSKD